MYPEQIKEKSMRGAKILLLIPLGVFLLGVVFFIVACFLEVPDKRGAIYIFYNIFTHMFHCRSFHWIGLIHNGNGTFHKK